MRFTLFSSATFLFLLVCMQLELNAAGEIPKPPSIEQSISMGYSRWKHIDLSTSGAESLFLGKTVGAIRYERLVARDYFVAVSLDHIVNRMEYSDVNGSTVNSQNPDELLLGIRYTRQWGPLVLDLKSKLNESLTSIHSQFRLKYAGPGVSVLIGSFSNQYKSVSEIRHEAESYHIEADYLSQQLQLSGQIDLSKLTLMAGLKRTIPWKRDWETDNPFHLTVAPATQIWDLGLQYGFDNDRMISFEGQFTKDTANLDLYKNDLIVGKAYAFDQEQSVIKIGYQSSDWHFGFARNTMSGEINGYLLAAPFGSLLTQLSGARFYVQTEGQINYYDAQLTYHSKSFGSLDLTLSNHLFFGDGELKYTGYIWQLFNPLTDLEIRELSDLTYVLDQMGIILDYKWAAGYSLSMEWSRLFPLYLDYSLRGTAVPSTSTSADLILGSHFNIELSYHF